MSKQVETAFEKLLGDCTDEERQKIYRMKDALGLQSHDALWIVLFALQHHHRLYEKIPAQIEHASIESSKTAAYRAQAQINQAVAHLVPTVEAGVKNAAEQAMRQVALTNSAFTLVSAAMVAGVILVIGFVLGAGIAQQTTDVRAIGVYAGAYGMLAVFTLLSFIWDYLRSDSRDVSSRTIWIAALFLLPVIWFSGTALWVFVRVVIDTVSSLLS